MKPIPKRRLIWGIIVLSVIALLCIWVSPWWLLAVPPTADFYFTRFIHWDWYKQIKNKHARSAVTLLGDIVFCLAGVYLLSLLLFQNFVIPSSSLEKTMLVGDYVVVSKLSYGPRMPNTPISFPLAHNVMPLVGGKSYCDHPLWKYRRIKGLGRVQRMDLVVFNFPAGDTVCLKMPNPDYYTLCKMEGRSELWANPERFGKIVYRPVDRRDHYVKRCVAVPGDSLSIRNNIVYINGKPEHQPSKLQLNYWVQTSEPLSDDFLCDLGISNDDCKVLPPDASGLAQADALGFKPAGNGTMGYIYHFPLTHRMRKNLESLSSVKRIEVEQDSRTEGIYPLNYPTGWARDNYGPVYVPKRGTTVRLTPLNLALYEHCIRNYEGHKLEIKPGGDILIDGKPSTTYTFGQDYYFMMGDNRHNSADSRYWGFVPEDHIVGKPVFIWLSLNKDKKLFDGKIRWGRMFRPVNAD